MPMDHLVHALLFVLRDSPPSKSVTASQWSVCPSDGETKSEGRGYPFPANEVADHQAVDSQPTAALGGVGGWLAATKIASGPGGLRETEGTTGRG